MLKKAGIIAAAAVAGVVALTPFAFATETSHDPSTNTTNVQKGDQDVQCDFANNQAVTGAGGLAGVAVGVPINATVPILSCNNANVDDVADLGTNNPNTEIATTR
jgi:hypothetical protein